MGLDIELKFKLEKDPGDEFMIFANNLLKDTCPICDGDEEAICGSFDEVYEIVTLSRYYEKGYERGQFISLYGTCAALEKLFEPYGISLYYHDDSIDPEVSELEYYKFDLEKRNELLEYFCKNGEAPYRKYDYTKKDYKNRR